MCQRLRAQRSLCEGKASLGAVTGRWGLGKDVVIYRDTVHFGAKQCLNMTVIWENPPTWRKSSLSVIPPAPPNTSLIFCTSHRRSGGIRKRLLFYQLCDPRGAAGHKLGQGEAKPKWWQFLLERPREERTLVCGRLISSGEEHRS